MELQRDLELIDDAQRRAEGGLSREAVYSGLEWEVGITIANEAGEMAPTPFVNLFMKGITPDGKVVSHPVRMTLQQFQDFAQNVQRIGDSISSYV